MSTPEEIWTARLHAAVDDHPGALAFDVPSYLAAGRKRARRNRAASMVAAAATVAVVATVAAMAAGDTRGEAPQPAAPTIPIPAAGANGWVAVDARRDDGQEAAGVYHTSMYLVRPGEAPRRLDVAGWGVASDACPTWSPDGTRLMFGRVAGPSDVTSGEAEVVIVPVDRNGATGEPTMIGLAGFEGWTDYEPHPCGTWAPDGRWVALAGNGQVWVVDTQSGAIRRLPDFRPRDLEWRPGTDELAIAGDQGDPRRDSTAATPVTIYTLATGELRQLGSVEAADISWSPDGMTLAYRAADEQELRLVDADGANARVLVDDLGDANHGIGPVWSPTGDRIAYQRLIAGRTEAHEVVLVNVADGTQTVIEPPQADGREWYPYEVSWSPDGGTLLYWAWSYNSSDGRPAGDGVLAVPADMPSRARVLMETAREPAWGRQPG